MAKVGPFSFLIETYGIAGSFIKILAKSRPHQITVAQSAESVFPGEVSQAKSLPDSKADSPSKQSPTMRQTHESPQPKSTAAEEIVTTTTTDCWFFFI